jgi:dihydrofolate synthase/folylpolyglutamate synthase
VPDSSGNAIPPITTYDDAYAAIWDRSGWDRGFISNPFAGDEAARLGLVRTRRLLDGLGSPDRAYPIVHVAGSKGKGSTCSFIDSILRAAGARSGRFLSPHLHSIRERFVVDDAPIDEDSFTSIVSEVMDMTGTVERGDPAIGTLTAWELSTAIALLWFKRRACDVAVVEVGLGGTLDATNVVTPAVSVITQLDYEHTAILGDTMAEIAANKAGIIKPGRPVASADQPEDGLDVIRARAGEVGARLLVANHDWSVTGTTKSFDARGPGWEHLNLRSTLRGQHQVENAGLAIAAVHLLDDTVKLPFPVDDEAIRTGLANTFVPGRFEVVQHHAGSTVVVDGAHSPESMRALAAAIRVEFPDLPVIAVVAMLSDKDPASVLPPLATIASRLVVTEAANPRALPTAHLASAARSLGAPFETAPSVARAIELAAQAIDGASENGVVVVTGSLVTAAEARVALGLA